MKLTRAGWLLLLDNFQAWTSEVKMRGFKNETEREDYSQVLQFIRKYWRLENGKFKLYSRYTIDTFESIQRNVKVPSNDSP